MPAMTGRADERRADTTDLGDPSDVALLLDQIAELAKRATTYQDRHGSAVTGAQAALARLVRGRGAVADEALLGVPLHGSRLLHVTFSSSRRCGEALGSVDVDGALVLVPAPSEAVLLVRNVPRQAGEDRALVSARRLSERLLLVDPSAACGISAAIATAGDVSDCAHDARDAADITASRTQSVLTVDECWHEVLLRRLQPAVRTGSFNPLMALLDYDRCHGTDLVRSLRTWLACGGDSTSAAAALHVHKNTLRYRLRRAQELAHVDLDEPRQRLALAVLLA